MPSPMLNRNPARGAAAKGPAMDFLKIKIVEPDGAGRGIFVAEAGPLLDGENQNRTGCGKLKSPLPPVCGA